MIEVLSTGGEVTAPSLPVETADDTVFAPDELTDEVGC